MGKSARKDILSLSIAERIDLIGDLWDSMAVPLLRHLLRDMLEGTDSRSEMPAAPLVRICPLRPWFAANGARPAFLREKRRFHFLACVGNV
jgi:hypothetical protein